MKRFWLAAILLAAPVLASALELKGARIESSDGKFLGIVGDRVQEDSVRNPFGTYGSRFNELSIWNKFGKYGDKFSDSSAFNPLAAHPPKVFVKGEKEPYLLTVSTLSTRRVDPNTLKPAE